MAKIAKIKCPNCGCDIKVRAVEKSGKEVDPKAVDALFKESDKLFKQADRLFERFKKMF